MWKWNQSQWIEYGRWSFELKFSNNTKYKKRFAQGNEEAIIKTNLQKLHA